jgi:hypothetical protein
MVYHPLRKLARDHRAHREKTKKNKSIAVAANYQPEMQLKA